MSKKDTEEKVATIKTQAIAPYRHPKKNMKDWRDNFNWKLHEEIQKWSADITKDTDLVIMESSLIDLTIRLQNFINNQKDLKDTLDILQSQGRKTIKITDVLHYLNETPQ